MIYSIENELTGSEKILWQGKPATGIKLQSADIFAIPFSIFWCGFSIFWELGASGALGSMKHQNAADPIAIIFPIFGLPFIAIGLYMVIGRFFADAKIRANTDYAVTNERVIIASGLFSRKVKSLNLKSVPDISISEKKDGSGTITFCETSSSSFNSFQNMPGMPTGRQQVPAFTMIHDVRNVYTILRKAQQECKA